MLENTEYPITILVLTVAVSLSLVAVLIYCGLCGNDEDDDYEYFYTDPQNIKAFNRTMSKQQGMGARPSLMAALGGTQSVPRIFPSGSTTVMLQAGSQQTFDLGANPRFKPEVANQAVNRPQAIGARQSLMTASVHGGMGGNPSSIQPGVHSPGPMGVMQPGMSQQFNHPQFASQPIPSYAPQTDPQFAPQSMPGGQQYNMMQQPVMAGPGAQQMPMY